MPDETLLADVRQSLLIALSIAGASNDAAHVAADATLTVIEAFATERLFVVSDRDPLVPTREELRSAAKALQRVEEIAIGLNVETKHHIQLSSRAARSHEDEPFDTFIQRASQWRRSLQILIASIELGKSGPAPDDEVRAVFTRCVQHWIAAVGTAPTDWRKAKSDGEPELFRMLYSAAFAHNPAVANRLSPKKFARAVEDLLR